MRPPGHCLAVELDHAHHDSTARYQVSAEVDRVAQTSKSDLMARGVAFDLLKVAKRIGPQCEAAEDEDLSWEKILTLDRIATDDSRSHQA